MTPLRVPFNRVAPVGRELEYIRMAIDGGHISGNGPFTARCEALLEDALGVRRALLTTSCTHALEMAALLLDIAPGDEVILPSFTFVSTVNAFVLRGARPVFVDIRDDTLNLDERLIERAITPRTRAIVVVHYAGVACEMDRILDLAGRRGLAVVEDNAHGLFGTYRNRWLGTLGALATLSFHETKNFSCGEGGALLVNDPRLIQRAEVLREKGTDRARFLRGEVDKYTWVDLGSSYVLSDMQAAFLLGQLEARGEIQARRRKVFDRYQATLSAWSRPLAIRMLEAGAAAEHPCHLFYLRLSGLDDRTEFIAGLRRAGVLAVSHYVPLHTSRMGRTYGYGKGDLPITEAVADELVRLPMFATLGEEDQDAVIEATMRWRPAVRPEVARG